MDSSSTASLAAAFVAGLAGSAHCFGMCGGIAAALGLRARSGTAGGRVLTAMARAMVYHTGRLLSYAIAGALAGLLGELVWRALDLAQAGRLLRMAAGVLLVTLAVGLISGRRSTGGIERLGGLLWSRLAPTAERLARGGGVMEALLLGGLWGWLPCGLVYSMLLLAAASAEVTMGAMIMLAFGAGTLPSMLGSSLLASQLAGLMQRAPARMFAGVLLLVFGLWTLSGPLLHGSLAGHGTHDEHGLHSRSASGIRLTLTSPSGPG